ncbi:MAG TPA: adenylate/guanylate cyclase domain-containing protein [Chloroflexota bacterium]
MADSVLPIETAMELDVATELRAFLIGDIRGYTRFALEHGDAAAAQLAKTFEAVVAKGIGLRSGQVVETRGDQVVGSFTSARLALRAAVALQIRFAQMMDANPSLHLQVGIGVDAGEVVPVDDGYRGRALNLAARLCDQARAGEVLASEAVIHLAGRMDDLEYLEGRELHLKGFAEPVRAIQVVAPDWG